LEGFSPPHCASVGGFSLHAGVCVPGRDRRRLERLCRYVARPPLASDRLSRSKDGRLVYRLRHPWRDGSTHVVFDSTELVERLAALVSPPRFHTVRYHGILAPAASRRDEVVPGGRSAPSMVNDDGTKPDCDSHTSEPTDVLAGNDARPGAAAGGRTQREPRQHRLNWAELTQRVFAADVPVCPKCEGRMRIMAAIHAPTAVRAILECLGLPSRPPPLAPAPWEPWNPSIEAEADALINQDR